MKTTMVLLAAGLLSIGYSTAQTLPAGSLDPDFQPGEGLEASPVLFRGLTVKARSDGGAFVGGDFISYDGVQHGSFRAVLPDGNLDNAFNTNFPCAGIVQDIHLAEDGSIFLANTFTCNGENSGKITKLMSDGSMNPDFDPGSGFAGGNEWAHAVALQDDKILVGGSFATYQGQTMRYLARLLPNGDLDPDFTNIFNESAYNFANGNLTRIVVQPDGKILITGYIYTFDETLFSFLRLMPDGSPDAAFNNNIAALNGRVSRVHLYEDGSMLALGTFTQYASTPAFRLCKLNADGSLNPGFTSAANSINSNAALNTYFGSMDVQSDGKIVVAGWFNEVGGQSYGSSFRLHPNGTFDDSWVTGTGFNYPATDVSIGANGEIYVVGRFWGYGGASTGGLVRLLSEELELLSSPALSSPSALSIFPNPARDQLRVESTYGMEQISIYDLSGRLVQQHTLAGLHTQQLHLNDLPKGVYLLSVEGASERQSRRIVVQ